MNKRTKAGFLILGIVAGLTVSAVLSGPDELEMEQRQYCEMVALNREDPTLGWPDFNNTYDSECTHENGTR